MPCGQKNRTREMIHSQTVTPPFAAMDGTTFRLKTATTNSRTRSRRPKTRRRRGACPSAGVLGAMTSLDNRLLRQSLYTGKRRRISSMSSGTHRRSAAFLLSLGEKRCDVFKRRQVLIDVRFSVLHRNRPLLVPPIGLCQHTTIYHGEPVVPPQIDIDRRPVAVIANLLGVQHQRSIYSGAGHVRLQSRLRHDPAITFRKSLAQLIDVRIILSREHFAKRGETRSHRDSVSVVGSAMKDFVL